MQLGRQTLSQAVSAAVLERIRSGEFGPGDRLPTEKLLMQEYGVGRNSVREAVQALVTLGLVDVRPGRGANRDRDRERCRDGLRDDLGPAQGGGGRRPLRLPQAARDRDRHACGRRRHARRPRDDRGQHRAFESALEQGRPISKLDDEFHAAVARASHNAIYATVLDAVSGLIANARRLSMNVPWASQRALVEHKRLYDAISVHDPEKAAEIMGTHLDGAIQAIQEGRAKAAAERSA